jgi:FAD/FMN-containing dehydrogenase/Fe-S oxidoreductase
MTLALRVLPTLRSAGGLALRAGQGGQSGSGAIAEELPDSAIDAIAAELREIDVGDVRFGPHDRLLYSTDASIYQVRPIGVVVPRGPQQVHRLVDFCAARGLAMLPRGGGTSLAGQCTNRAIVVDLSAFCRGVLGVDVIRRVAHVEAGVTIEGLNRELASRDTGLFFAPDPATLNQATIGGCIGNNAAGARSIRYGRMSENIVGIDVLLVDGSRLWLGPGAGRTGAAAFELARRVAEVVRPVARQIRLRYPKTVRRNAGYGLDMILKQLDRGAGPEDLDLSGLICGSEGTLAIVLGARLKLHKVPATRALAIVYYPTLEDALAAVPGIVATGPSAIELLDDVVLKAAQGNIKTREYLKALGLDDELDGEGGGNGGQDSVGAVLYCEYEASVDASELNNCFMRLRGAAGSSRPRIVEFRDMAAISKAWALRTAAEPLLHGISSRRKPLTFVEDNVVPVARLGEFIAGLKRIIAAHGTTAAFYAHASVGVLHVRPLLDLHETADQVKLRSIAVAAAELARTCGGVMSGEHGDGRVRGPLLERFFGPELTRAFVQIKAVFDPHNLLNPGMIVDPGPIDSITSSLRSHEQREVLGDIDTFFDYSDQGGFAAALERCNGAGVCRKMSGGTMCPSYRATLDERHSTRGRGNALRQAVVARANDSAPDWADAATIKTLDLCLSCKACKTECPSNVDLARLKAEYTAQRYRSSRVPLSAYFWSGVRRINRVGSMAPGLVNALVRFGPVRGLLNRSFGITPQRPLPRMRRSIWRELRRKPAEVVGPSAPRIVLFGDCFTAFNEPQVGLAAVKVLQSLGYAVDVVDAGCCGRAMISKSLLPEAVAAAERALAVLLPLLDDPQVRGVVVCEPSCLSAIKDDWLQLRLAPALAKRQALADRAMLVEEFVEKAWELHPRRPNFGGAADRQILLHGHCHQKALWGDGGSAADKYETSMRIGELALLPAVRTAGEQTMIVAPGTSCRQQILHGTGRVALHPIEVMAAALDAEKASFPSESPSSDQTANIDSPLENSSRGATDALVGLASGDGTDAKE